jgi:hypothetical protein
MGSIQDIFSSRWVRDENPQHMAIVLCTRKVLSPYHHGQGLRPKGFWPYAETWSRSVQKPWFNGDLMGDIHSGNLTELWKITSLIVKSATHDPFSIAMLLYWRVVFVGDDTTYLRNHPKWCWSNHGWDASGPIRNHPRNQPSGGGHVTLW